MAAECCQPSPAPESPVGRPSTNVLSPSVARASSACDMNFGIHNSSWLDTPDPAEAFETVKAKAQRAEETHLHFSPKAFFNHSPLPASAQKQHHANAPSPYAASLITHAT